MRKMLNKKIFIWALIVILAFGAAYFSYAWGKKTWPFSEQKYQVVQLASGEVYYGKLRTFPSFKLSDVYFIQKTQPANEGEQAGTQLLPLSSLFFTPQNTMRLNKGQILWWADLSSDSQILEAIKEAKK